MDYQARINRIREKMADAGVKGVYLAPNSGDYTYVTGIPRKRPDGSLTHSYGDWFAGVYLTEKECVYVIPAMHQRFVKAECANRPWITDIIVLPEGQDLFKMCKDVLVRLGLIGGKIAMPKQAMAKTLIYFKELCPEVEFYNFEHIVAPMRAIKDAEEIEIMRGICHETDLIFAETVKDIEYGMSEGEIFSLLEAKILQHGASGSSFNTGIQITPAVTSNELNTIDGVVRFTDLKVHKGCTLAFDFGIMKDGYVSDFGRTIYFGEPTEERVRAHKTVMDCQKAAIAAMKAGQITCEQLDKLAHDFIEDAGYPRDAFFHRLGHGIGIDVHEYPFLNETYDEVLQEGMAFTIEPSILVPGIWTRVEDIVVVTKDGGMNLNAAGGVDELIVID